MFVVQIWSVLLFNKSNQQNCRYVVNIHTIYTGNSSVLVWFSIAASVAEVSQQFYIMCTSCLHKQSVLKTTCEYCHGMCCHTILDLWISSIHYVNTAYIAVDLLKLFGCNFNFWSGQSKKNTPLLYQRENSVCLCVFNIDIYFFRYFSEWLVVTYTVVRVFCRCFHS